MGTGFFRRRTDPPQRRLGGLIGRLKEERGVALIEFSLIMVPFFVILFGIFEVAFVFWGTYELENATEDAARQIRTGQASNMSEAGFRTQICSRVVLLSRCEEELRLDVRSFDSYAAIQTNSPDPLDDDGNLKTDFSYTTGGPRSIMLVSTFYRWPLINPISGYSLSNMADGDRLLRASAAFRNEPFPEN
jgi:Flp pilus assembly protein TadG